MTRRFAVLTGASSGIGLELAKQFAQHDFDLLLAADQDLDAAERQLGAAQVQTQTVDLASAAGVDQLAEAALAAGRPIDALVVNAGVGYAGPFTETKLDDQLKMIDLNVTGAVRLVHRLLPSMVAAGRGRVLFTSSVAGTQPTPYEAVYGGTKSFLYQFSLGLREELKGTGVTVTALLPGPTDTNFFQRAGMLNTLAGKGPKDDPALVARQGYDGLMAGKKAVLAGDPIWQTMTAMNKFLPDTVKAKMYKTLAKPRQT